MTSALRVSTDTAAPPAASWRMTGTIRSISSPSQTGFAPGPVDSPPTSMIAAPCRRHVGARRRGRRRVGELPAVGEAVGRHVDDAHHLRLVEADGALAELQRRPRRRQRLPLRGHVLVEAALRSPRPAPARSTRACGLRPASARPRQNQFSPPASRATLPSWPNGESTKPVGRRSVRITRAIARRDAVAARRRCGCSAPPSSTCQKVQPLHDGAPCSAAPTLWIEPDVRVAGDRAVGADAWRSSGAWRRSAPSRPGPARFRPARRTRRAAAARLSATVCHRAFVERQGRVDPLAARPSHKPPRARSRSSAGPSRRATAPVVPVPKKGSSTTSPGFVQASRIR